MSSQSEELVEAESQVNMLEQKYNEIQMEYEVNRDQVEKMEMIRVDQDKQIMSLTTRKERAEKKQL